jgi:hypothetical protein
MSTRDSIFVKSVWCPGGFLYLNEKLILEIWEIICYHFVEYIMCHFGLHFFSFFDAHGSLIWSFDGVTEFLDIPFATFESFV